MPVSFSRNTAELEALLGYRFIDKGLLTEALIHTSYQYENPSEAAANNERLEFLGDSVLGMAIAETLFSRQPELCEANMSKMRSYLVNKAVLAEIASEIRLGSYVMLGKGEEATGGRKKQSILADAVEALFGAAFLDSGYEAAKAMILRLYAERISDAMEGRDARDFKSELQERAQASFGILPEYRIIKQEGEEHLKIFTAEVCIRDRRLGTGSGRSKKEAQMQAAKEALSQFE